MGYEHPVIGIVPIVRRIVQVRFALEEMQFGSPDVSVVGRRRIEIRDDGRLAKDILNWLRTYRRDLFPGLEYWIIEPSARRRERQIGDAGGGPCVAGDRAAVRRPDECGGASAHPFDRFRAKRNFFNRVNIIST